MKTMKILLITILLLSLYTISYAQESAQTKIKSYELDHFLITPQTKTISAYTMIGGIDWDGYTYIPDSTIQYDKAILIILGSQIFFKEKKDIGFDFETLHVIEDSKQKKLYADKNNIYHINDGEIHHKIDISAYNIINDYIYQDKSGNLYFLHDNGYKLEQIVGLPELDLSTLKRETEHYFSDKNGYYILGAHYDKESKVHRNESRRISKTKIPAISKQKSKFNDKRIVVRNIQAYYQGYPIKEKIYIKNLKFITNNNAETGYMTDEVSLIYLGKVTGYTTEKINKRDQIVLNRSDTEQRIIPYKNPSQLKVINSDILVDDNYIYNGTYKGINKIPIDSLGLDVKIILNK